MRRYAHWCLAATLLSCASGAASPPWRLAPLPTPAEERDRLLHSLGRRALSALQARDASPLLLDAAALSGLLSPEAATAAQSERAALRASGGMPIEAPAMLQAARYAGVCVQRARELAPGPPVGLRERGFVADRLLVIALEPGGGRVAAWIEGSFLLTDRGFFAITLARVEPPRRDHSDLDLAACDLEVGRELPRPVVVGAAASY